MYYVYALHSLSDGDLYIGYSEKLRKRVKDHFNGSVKSTKNRRPLRLIYYEAYVNELDVKKREKFLKSGSGHRFLNKQLSNYFSQPRN